jgi:hypothetical protein
MPEIEMPPQYAGSYPDPQDTEGHVRRAVEREAGDRLGLWTTLMLEAVDEFETAANLHSAHCRRDLSGFDSHGRDRIGL